MLEIGIEELSNVSECIEPVSERSKISFEQAKIFEMLWRSPHQQEDGHSHRTRTLISMALRSLHIEYGQISCRRVCVRIGVQKIAWSKSDETERGGRLAQGPYPIGHVIRARYEAPQQKCQLRVKIWEYA